MARKWIAPIREPQDRAASATAPGSAGPAPGRSPYSDQYETLISQGHTRPTPAFGAPALVWHVAIWPRRAVDGSGEACDPHDTAGIGHLDAKPAFERRRELWLQQINAFIERLQGHCRLRRGQPKQFALRQPHDLKWQPSPADKTNFFRPIDILVQEIVPFTLWWGAPGETELDAIRVCVHPEVNVDYACFSFYMDIGQAWNGPHIAAADAATGRRRLLLQAVDDIRRICEAQLEPVHPRGAAAVDQPAHPELLHSPDGRSPEELHAALKAHRNLLYVDAWEAFAAEMGCRLEDIAGTRGEVFTNIRGLIMPTAGMSPGRPRFEPDAAEAGSAGTAPFATFSADDDLTADGAEPNAVVKAFWPFVRRVTPRADFRDFIACGVFDWRAIYITALGSSSQYGGHQVREPSPAEMEGQAAIRVPDALLEADERSFAQGEGPFDSLVHSRLGGRGGNNHPVRYLMLTKHAPHPRQIGRIAERINSMGTMRLYALKDWSAVRNADAYIRIFGQELDQITKGWGRDRRLINKLTSLEEVRKVKDDVARLEQTLKPARSEEEKKRIIAAFVGPNNWRGPDLDRLRKGLPTYTPRKPAPWVMRVVLRAFYLGRYRELLKGMEDDLVADIRHAVLYEISNEVETGLIEVSANLDEMGFGAVGGLHFRLNRSAYYVREFNILLKTLRVRNIPTWTSYEQFVQRGLGPAFHYLRSVGKRLRRVRSRLLTITETIETTALVGQSAATRHNTAVLRRTTTIAIVILLVFLASTSQVRDFAARIAVFAYSRLPSWVTSWIDELWGRLETLFT